MHANRFGLFHASGRAFTITNPATPMPWVNVISNGRYGLVVSQNGGGFSFFDDAQHCVLTRWEMDLVRDQWGKHLYLADLDAPAGSRRVWSVAPTPCQVDYSHYECVHRPGSTRFITEYNGIRSEWTLAVHPDAPCEIWLVTLTNLGFRPRRLRVSSYFEWCCGVAPDSKREFHRLFLTTKYDPARRAIVATKNMWDVPARHEREHWNRPWPYAAAHAIVGDFEGDLAFGDKRLFLGKYGTIENPRWMAVDTNAELRTGFGRFSDPCAALGGELTIPPGVSVKLHYVLAIGDGEKEVLKTIDCMRDRAVAERSVEASGEMWADLLDRTSVETERSDFDLLNNTWLPYQAISGRLWGRTGYYQQSGAFGFRDQLQDSQIWLPIDPARTKCQILLHASRQFSDGSVNHWWHQLANFGNHTACSDDYLWLPFVTANYIKETGDRTILDERVAWLDGEGGAGGSGIRNTGEAPASIREHCKRAISLALSRISPRGLPLIGSCDWNDGLSSMGVGGKGESVWLGMFLSRILSEWACILDWSHRGSGGSNGHAADGTLAAEYRRTRQQLNDRINEHAWDGQWYRYGTKDNGDWVGSSLSPAGRIHLNTQTWSILADVAPKDRADIAWRSVEEHLLSPFGPLLLAPAYTEPDADLGYITRYSPGCRENGGVYMHAATWALAAACKRRDAACVGRIWDSISPPRRSRDADAYWAEPYVMPGNVDGPLSEMPGRAGWTWYTGSAAWLNRVSLEWMLGIRPVWLHAQSETAPSSSGLSALMIDPCPPKDFGKVDVTRLWRGVNVRVRFDAAEFKAGTKPSLIVNGDLIDGCVLTEGMMTRTARLDVEVRWGGSDHAEVYSKASAKAGSTV